jgi:hypothetical protein
LVNFFYGPYFEKQGVQVQYFHSNEVHVYIIPKKLLPKNWDRAKNFGVAGGPVQKNNPLEIFSHFKSDQIALYN